MGRHRWMIATPLDGVYYDGEQLIHQRKCSEAWQQLAQNVEDPHSAMWLTYYSHIFNPARLNERMMRQEMPVKYWKNLPEASLIPELIAGAQAREARMVEAGAQDCEPGDEEGTTTFWTDPAELDLVSRALPAHGFNVLSVKLGYKPKNPVNPANLTAEQLEEVENFLAAIDSNDDVQNVFVSLGG